MKNRRNSERSLTINYPISVCFGLPRGIFRVSTVMSLLRSMVGESRGAGKRRIKPADASVLEYLLSHQEQNTDDESADSDWSESKAKRRRGSDGDGSGDKADGSGTDASSDDSSSRGGSGGSSNEDEEKKRVENSSSSSSDDDDGDEVYAARCAVCLLEAGDADEQEMQTCYRCGLNVHIVCYGNAKDLSSSSSSDDDDADNDDDDDKVWFCEPCLAESKARSCLFCPSSHGALKQVGEHVCSPPL